MSKEKVDGICRLCGLYAEMSKEHIPPKSAFNNTDRAFETIAHTVRGWGRQKFRGGVGIHTLCNPCNNKTGGDYGTAYADWARQGLDFLQAVQRKGIDEFSFNIKPLNVLKQVSTMAVAMLSPNVIDRHLELRRFILNRDSRYMPSEYAIFAYLTVSDTARMESEIGVLSTNTGEVTYVYAEVAFPPFGFIAIPRKALLPPAKIREHRLYPIDWFTYYEYDETETVQLRLPGLSVQTQYPLDYRTEEQVTQEAVLDMMREGAR